MSLLCLNIDMDVIASLVLVHILGGLHRAYTFT